MSQMIEFQRPDGKTSQAYLAQAQVGAPAKAPGLILIQEWWGLNEHIKQVADRFAAAGFNTLAPDLFHGRVASDTDEARHLMTGLDFADATFQDLQGAVQFLAARSGKIGVLGFCMGGALTVAAAVHVKGVSAAVCYYGIPPAEFANPAQIKIPFQGHFALYDDWCTPAAVKSLTDTMRQAGQHPVIYAYAADHAFFNNGRPEVYNETCAKQSFDRSTGFLRHELDR
ncbi:MAG: dienelactone hydrolase family protein [Burkholderiaceae bacterium]|nr:dienelactone hydrolase family protein [Burkholderiaceae bacterium]